MKKIVIIGATGYVGSAILKEALGRGHQVKAIVRDPSKLTLIHPHLKVVGGSVTDTDFLSRELAKSDAVISAFNPGWSNPNIYEETLEGYGSILCAVRNSGVHRFLMVGGAGSLLVAPGRQLMDEPDVPKKLLPGIRGMAKVYTDLLLPEKSVDLRLAQKRAEIIERYLSQGGNIDSLIFEDVGRKAIEGDCPIAFKCCGLS